MTDRYMRAYYHTFTPTGVDAVDAILEAVAEAGRAYHSTSCWADAEEYGHDGYWSLIEQRAQDAADIMRRTETALEQPKAADDTAIRQQESVMHWQDIETAPKDGSRIIGRIVSAEWSNDIVRGRAAKVFVADIYWDENLGWQMVEEFGCDIRPEPSDWMPQPLNPPLHRYITDRTVRLRTETARKPPLSTETYVNRRAPKSD